MSSGIRLLSAASLLSLAAGAVLNLPISASNSYKTVKFDIGTPAKSYYLLFDTGSSPAWIVDNTCAATCKNSSGYQRVGYNAEASSTSNNTGSSAEIEYLGGKVAGPTIKDVWAIGETTWEQSFIAANTSNWSSLAADGFLGLSFRNSADGVSPVFETMMASGQVDQPRFGIYYGSRVNNTSPDGTVGTPGDGVVTLGGSRETEFSVGNLTTVPVLRVNGGYDSWRIQVIGATANRTAAGPATGGNGTDAGSGNGTATSSTYISFDYSSAIFDTGASGITLPNKQNEAIYKAIGWNYTAITSGQHIPLCSEFNDTWSVTFTLGDYRTPGKLTIKGSQLAVPGFAYRDDACWPPFDGSSTSYSLIGSRFLRNFYTVWDYGKMTTNPQQYNPTLGFGTLKSQPDWVNGERKTPNENRNCKSK